jgi:hypothetical protein
MFCGLLIVTVVESTNEKNKPTKATAPFQKITNQAFTLEECGRDARQHKKDTAADGQATHPNSGHPQMAR